MTTLAIIKSVFVGYLLLVYSLVTFGSFRYAFYAIDNGLTSADTVQVLLTIQGLTTLVFGYAFKLLNKD